ncbi:MAG: virulence RhuM family protein [Prevotella sp.]|nr:virulence RhuM family protein [Prevotella sp.]
MSDVQSTNKGEIVMYQPDDTIRLEVRMGEDTVWLTQQQMAQLFNKDRTVIGRHIRNIYKEKELEQNITCAKFAHMGTEGDQSYEYMAYNLDVIISVGYRVKSARGTKFRQWANKVLKEYLLKGYAINQQFANLENKIDSRFQNQESRIKQIETKIDFFVRTSLPPVEGIFYDGQIFDAYAQIIQLIKQAKRSIVLIDNYIDETTLTMLSKRKSNVEATIYTTRPTQQQQLDIQRHNQQFQPVTIKTCRQNHDRFLIIDEEVYAFGASLKDAGKKLFAYIKMQETTADELLSIIR